ncbi:MAG: hypothetical protein NC122_03975 [Faecalibacterium sp.]|nr:hypothetical protein [Ruminococcus sp.]MCM1391743.1 hypothetical protein [Ruminococcus sp.]MCM1485344.1 hypothetical protein [Faecalibacterium sp.]
MKSKTLGKIILAVSVGIIAIVWFFYDDIMMLLTKPEKPTAFYISTLQAVVAIIILGTGIISYLLFNRLGDTALSKKHIIGGAAIIIIILVLPFTAIKPSTTITADSIIDYSVAGDISEIHKTENACSAHVCLHPMKVGYEISYSLAFDDGYEILLSKDTSKYWWSIVTEIDTTINKHDIKKTVEGWEFYEEAYRYLDFDTYDEQAKQMLDLN